MKKMLWIIVCLLASLVFIYAAADTDNPSYVTLTSSHEVSAQEVNLADTSASPLRVYVYGFREHGSWKMHLYLHNYRSGVDSFYFKIVADNGSVEFDSENMKVPEHKYLNSYEGVNHPADDTYLVQLYIAGPYQLVLYAKDSAGNELSETVQIEAGSTFDMVVGEPSGIPIDTEHFPDGAFRLYLKNHADKDKNEYLSDAEIAETVSITIPENSGLNNLNGIGYFTELNSLIFSNNNVTALDLSSNTKLETLSCGGNQLQLLNLSANNELSYLECGNNLLTELNVSENPKLTNLHCQENHLHELVVNNNKMLTDLWCSENELSSLDISQNTKLTTLAVSNNQLTGLDISHCKKLTSLSAENNQISKLVMNKHPALGHLECWGNNLSVLNITNCKLKSCLEGNYSRKATKKGGIIYDYFSTFPDYLAVDQNVTVIAGDFVSEGIEIYITGSNYVAIGKKIQLKASAMPKGTKLSIVWSSSDSSVASINSKGVVEGKKPGKVTITASYKKNPHVQKKYTVEVMKKAASKVTISGGVLKIKIGESIQLTAKVLPSAAAQNVIWESSDESVLSYGSRDGSFTATKNGTAVITAVAADGSGTKGSFTVTVSPEISYLEMIKKAEEDFKKQEKKFNKHEKKLIGAIESSYHTVKQDNEEKAENAIKNTLALTGLPPKVAKALLNAMYTRIESILESSPKDFKNCRTGAELVTTVARQLSAGKDQFPIKVEKETYIVTSTTFDIWGATFIEGTIQSEKGGKEYVYGIASTHGKKIQQYMDALRDFAESKIKEAWKTVLTDAKTVLEVDKVIKFMKTMAKDKILFWLEKQIPHLSTRVEDALNLANKYKKVINSFDKIKEIKLDSATEKELVETIKKYTENVNNFTDAVNDLLPY